MSFYRLPKHKTQLIMDLTKHIIKELNQELPPQKRLPDDQFIVDNTNGEHDLTTELLRDTHGFELKTMEDLETVKAWIKHKIALSLAKAAMSKSIVDDARQGKPIHFSLYDIMIECKPIQLEHKKLVLSGNFGNDRRIFMLMPEAEDAVNIELCRSSHDLFDNLPTCVTFAITTEEKTWTTLEGIKYFFQDKNRLDGSVSRVIKQKYFNSRRYLLKAIIQETLKTHPIVIPDKTIKRVGNTTRFKSEIEAICRELNIIPQVQKDGSILIKMQKTD